MLDSFSISPKKEKKMISGRLFDHLSSGNLVIVTWWADCEWKHLDELSGSNLEALRWIFDAQIVSHDRSMMMMMFSIRIFFRRNSITTKMFRTTPQEDKKSSVHVWLIYLLVWNCLKRAVDGAHWLSCHRHRWLDKIDEHGWPRKNHARQCTVDLWQIDW